jgi:molybdenum cofactor cytidylyltransferase
MTGIIILAAGSSSRLGRPKQNLVYKDKTLLQRAVEIAGLSVCEPVIVILGANADVIGPTIKDLDITIVQNNHWEEGMASSIRAGINALKKYRNTIDSAILMLCDQPFADVSLLNRLVEHKSINGIVACSYSNTIGAPVLFSASYFDELLSLKGQEGAKKLLLKYPEDITTVLFPLGNIDIDTMEDFEKL